MSARALRSLRLLLAAITLVSSPRSALAKPEWAKPFLELPTPRGPYIARSDAWVIVYSEVEFALTEKNALEARHRFLYENVSDRPEAFTASLFHDEGALELKDPALHVQRTFWHRINLTRTAGKMSIQGTRHFILASVENIEPRKRVVLEYTLTDKLGFFSWMRETVPRSHPIGKVRYLIAPESAVRGLVLELRTPHGEPHPASFAREPDGSWIVTAVPAWERIGTWRLLYQPDIDDLFPFFLARLADDPDDGLPGGVRRYRREWNARLAAIDAAQVQARVSAIAGAASSPAEKAARLAAFVQQEIQYDDSNEKSLDAWLPLATEETLRSMKADCKGKVMLLQAMLKAAGISSAPVLMHAGSEYASPGDRLSTSRINHVILAVDVPGSATYGATLLEGPAKGRVLFDPTWRAGSFGQPLPGYEGLPALLVGETDQPLFAIRTSTPSHAKTDIKLDMRVDADGSASIKIRANDNGASPLLSQLVEGGTSAQHKELIMNALDELLPKLQVVKELCSPPAVFPAGPAQVDLEIVSAHCLQELASRSILPNPLGLTAILAGLPTSLRPAPPPRPDDAITLAPPWDLKRNTYGIPTVVEAAVRLELPRSLRWAPPSPRREEKPWSRFMAEWTSTGENVFEGRLHLELSRGAWPKEERRARLKLMDELFTALASPLLLEKAPGP